MTRIVASMIVHNEVDRYLPLAVTHLLTFCEEVRVLDDGSSDGTFEWLSEQERVSVRRNPGPTFYEYESKARQNLLEWTIAAQPEYVLSIDADEFISDPSALERTMAARAPVFTLDMEEVWNLDAGHLHLRWDGQWKPRRCPILWLAPRRLNSNLWQIPDRKLACGREPLGVRRSRTRDSGSSVLHFGWSRRSEREARAHRYEVHDGGEFHRDAHLQSILWPDERVVTRPRQWPETLEPFKADLLELTDR